MITSDTSVEITILEAWSYSVIESIAPAAGQGGTVVTISGASLTADGENVTKVELDGVEASIVSFNDTVVIVEADAITNGNDQEGTVVLELSNGQVIESIALADSSLVKKFTYKVPGEITSVTPEQGQLNTVVVIEGTDLFGQGDSLDTVTLAGVEATIGANSKTSVSVTAGESGQDRFRRCCSYCKHRCCCDDWRELCVCCCW